MNSIEQSPYLQVLGGLDLKNHDHLQYKNLYILAFIAISKQIDRDDLSNVFYGAATNRRSSLRGCINKINSKGILQTNNNVLSLTSLIDCDLYALEQALDYGAHQKVRELYRNPNNKLLYGKVIPKKSSSDLELWLEDVNKALLERVYQSRITLLADLINQSQQGEKQNEQEQYELRLVAKESIDLFPFEIDPFAAHQELYLEAAINLYSHLLQIDNALAALLQNKVREDSDLELKLSTQDSAPHKQADVQIVGAIEESKIAHFKGRKQEALKLANFLQSDAKLMQVLGRAGIGKTSFVTKFIRDIPTNKNRKTGAEQGQITPSYHAILFANLDANSPAVIPELLFRVLDEPQLSRVKSYWDSEDFPLSYKWERLFSESLKDLGILFILDNFESFLSKNSISHPDLASFLKIFLNSSHQSKLIITSRYELISDELVRQPTLGTSLRLSKLSIHDSTELLIDRDDTQGRFKKASQEQLLEVVKRCHGIPKIYDVLLLKLKKEPLTNIEMMLNSSSIEEVLAAPAKVMLDQLSTDDLEILETLAVFSEAVPLEVILFMNDQTETDSAIAKLNNLVNSAALIMNEQQYLSLHPLDRDYLVNHSLPTQSNKLERLHIKAAKFYQSQFKDKSLWQEPTDLSPQLKAFDHLYNAGQINPAHFDAAAEVLSGIEFGYLLSWGKSQDLLEKRQSLIGKLTDPMLIGQNFNSLGVAATNLRHFELSRNYLNLSIYHYRKLGTAVANRMSFYSIGNLAIVHTKLGNLDKAIKLYKYNIDFTEKLEHSVDPIEIEIYESLAVDFTLIADAYVEAEDYQQALNYYKKAQAVFTKVARERFPHFYTVCHLGLAKVHLSNQDLSKAKELAILANRIARDSKEHGLAIESLCLKAKIECMSNNYQLALDLFNTALSLSSKIGEVNLEIDTYAVMYKSFKEQESYQQIAQYSLEKGVSLAEQIKNEQQRALFFEN